jgi:hypothetical protein
MTVCALCVSYPSVYMSVWLTVYLSCLSICMSVSQTVSSLSLLMSDWLYACFVCLSVCLTDFLLVLFVYPYVWLTVCLTDHVYPSACLTESKTGRRINRVRQIYIQKDLSIFPSAVWLSDSVCLIACLVWLCTLPVFSICLFVCLSCLYLCLATLSVYPSACLTPCQFVCLILQLSVCLFVYHICMSIHLSVGTLLSSFLVIKASVK